MPHGSWKTSREAEIWRRLRPDQARKVLLQAYGEEAGAEALLRAFLSEPDRDKAAVRFRLLVYQDLTAAEPAGSDSDACAQDATQTPPRPLLKGAAVV